MKISRYLDIKLDLQKGFHDAGLKSCNDTPSEICKLPTLDRFKKVLKAHLKS